MGFWGLEVKPGKPQPYRPENEQGKLHVTQATLGAGLGKGKSVIQCSTGDKNPIYLCSLLPNKIECCTLNLEFDDNDESVKFSVAGDRSIHLSGYIESYEQEYLQDGDDSDGIDIGESESDESSDYDSEEDHMDELEDFLDDSYGYPHSSVPKSRVVIEEIEDEEKPVKDTKTKRPKKKTQDSEDESAKKQIIVKESANIHLLASEDEDGLPISKEEAGEPENKIDEDEQVSNKKRKAKPSEQESVKKNNKKKKQTEKQEEITPMEKADEQVQKKTSAISSNQKAQNGTVNNAMSESSKIPDNSAEKKNKKKKKKKDSSVEAEGEKKNVSSSLEKQKSDSISEGTQMRTYPNGLIVEEIGMGKPDGKRASPGKQVSVRYIGKLQKNGKIFDSNIGKAPFKFRLGLGQVIKGWDVGVNGMRVGDKRRLTIPPSMGYGERGAGGQIPPNAWLMFDVELIDVR